MQSIEYDFRYSFASRMTAESLVNIEVNADGAVQLIAHIRAPNSAVTSIPDLTASFTLTFLPAPRFCAVNVVTAESMAEGLCGGGCHCSTGDGKGRNRRIYPLVTHQHKIICGPGTVSLLQVGWSPDFFAIFIVSSV